MTAETTEQAENIEAAPLPEGGDFAIVELLGHRQRAGYVTEVTRFGAALLHIDLPAKIWGGDASAWEEYTAAALYGMHPASETAIRAAWDREVEAQRRAREWQERDQARWTALPPGGDEDEDEDDLVWEREP
jgi:hypothetical protein